MSRPLELSDSELQTLIRMAGDAIQCNWGERKQQRDHVATLRKHDFLADLLPEAEAQLQVLEKRQQEFATILSRLHRLDIARRVDADLKPAGIEEAQ